MFGVKRNGSEHPKKGEKPKKNILGAVRFIFFHITRTNPGFVLFDFFRLHVSPSGDLRLRL